MHECVNRFNHAIQTLVRILILGADEHCHADNSIGRFIDTTEQWNILTQGPATTKKYL